MKPFGVVYGLYDPTTLALRYVGQTTQSVANRVAQHLSLSCLRKRVHVARWLASLRAAGKFPVVDVLDVAMSREELDASEIHHIKEARERGCDLTNAANGGRANSGMTRTPEHCARISAALRGLTVPQDVRDKIAKTSVGRKFSAEHKAKIGRASLGRRLSLESRAKMASSRKNRGQHDTYILRRHSEGASQSKIAGELGIVQSTVGRCIARSKRFR